MTLKTKYKCSWLYLVLKHVPMKFARSNGLTTKGLRTQIVLVDEAKRTWPATLHVKRDQIRLTGWRKLMIKTDLKIGDACMFKLVEDGEVPVFSFYTNLFFVGLHINMVIQI
ncbi:putative transcription factor B3-Domain family [Helianthus annuus]|nr:putative transcription factor B3-Domain family [Helianthus annuus]